MVRSSKFTVFVVMATFLALNTADLKGAGDCCQCELKKQTGGALCVTQMTQTLGVAASSLVLNQVRSLWDRFGHQVVLGVGMAVAGQIIPEKYLSRRIAKNLVVGGVALASAPVPHLLEHGWLWHMPLNPYVLDLVTSSATAGLALWKPTALTWLSPDSRATLSLIALLCGGQAATRYWEESAIQAKAASSSHEAS